jgi:hypothetical protein
MLGKGADVNAENYLINTIIKAYASSSFCPLNEEDFAVCEEINLLLDAMANENPLLNVSDKKMKTWEAYGTMNC